MGENQGPFPWLGILMWVGMILGAWLIVGGVLFAVYLWVT